MTVKIRVGVIFGGRSGEHEVSVRSARAVVDALDPLRYSIIPIAIAHDGRWLSPVESASMLPEETRSLLPDDITGGPKSAVAIIADPSRPGLVRLNCDGEQIAPKALDVIFPVMHGSYGEDGTIQGLLEMAGVPYIGCGVLASSCGMDKVTMKALFREADLPICQHTWFLRREWEHEREAVFQRVEEVIGYPCFVKPANLGSSVGISRAVDRQTLESAFNLAARYDRKVIVEEGLDAREIECAVIGNDVPEASLPGEYVILDKQAAFLDYTEKYSGTGHVEFVVPANLPGHTISRVQELAKRAFRAVDGSGLARVDFFLRRDNGELLLNELNTMPGLTEVSGYPKLWAASGLPFESVLDRLIQLAFERHQDKMRNQTHL
jgi:D-alanine-D-alanine ligase